MPPINRTDALLSVITRVDCLKRLAETVLAAETSGLHVSNARGALQGAVEAISDAILEIE